MTRTDVDTEDSSAAHVAELPDNVLPDARPPAVEFTAVPDTEDLPDDVRNGDATDLAQGEG